jgi:hypothetical protein
MSCPLPDSATRIVPTVAHQKRNEKHSPLAPEWMRQWLWAAAVYNILFGAWVVLFPNHYFEWLGMPVPNYPQLWQCIGMIVGVYGLGYFIAGFSPLTHWPIVLVGFLGKIFGPLGFLQSIILGTLPLSFGLILLTNDLVWWIPFYGMLSATWNHFTKEPLGESVDVTLSDEALFQSTHLANGKTLWEAAQQQPVLLVALRHLGCTFCREMVDDVLNLEKNLPDQTLIVFMTTGNPADTKVFFDLKTDSVPDTISKNITWTTDPERILYRQLSLKRGTFAQIFGLKTWKRVLSTDVFQKYGLGSLQGDGFQMPGLFWLENGSVVSSWRAQSASDRVDLNVIQRLLGVSAKRG